jgi:hypothetical protein
MKRCRRCGKPKPLEDFYRHPQMRDGRMNICKVCHRAAVRANRRRRIDYYREFDRQRANQPYRVEARRQYQTTAAYKLSHAISAAKYREHNPQMVRAWNAVAKAKAKGTLKQKPCALCGSKNSEAHHPDHGDPLCVSWLCPRCHNSNHAHQRELKRKRRP